MLGGDSPPRSAFVDVPVFPSPLQARLPSHYVHSLQLEASLCLQSSSGPSFCTTVELVYSMILTVVIAAYVQLPYRSCPCSLGSGPPSPDPCGLAEQLSGKHFLVECCDRPPVHLTVGQHG